MIAQLSIAILYKSLLKLQSKRCQCLFTYCVYTRTNIHSQCKNTKIVTMKRGHGLQKVNRFMRTVLYRSNWPEYNSTKRLQSLRLLCVHVCLLHTCIRVYYILRLNFSRKGNTFHIFFYFF